MNTSRLILLIRKLKCVKKVSKKVKLSEQQNVIKFHQMLARLISEIRARSKLEALRRCN